MSFRGRGGGGGFRGGGNRFGNRQGAPNRGRGGGFNRGGGRGNFNKFHSDEPPEKVMPFAHFTHPCANDLVLKVDMEDVPYFNAPVYLENKQSVGKIDEIFGPIHDYFVSVKLTSDLKASSFQVNDKLFIDPAKILPLKRFLPQPPAKKGEGNKSGGRGGGRGGRGGGNRGGGGGGFGGRGGFRGRGGGGGNRGGGNRGGGNRFSGSGRGGFTRR